MKTRLKLEAVRQNRPMAEFIRDAIRGKLDALQRGRSKKGGAFSSGRSDVADQAEKLFSEGRFGSS